MKVRGNKRILSTLTPALSLLKKEGEGRKFAELKFITNVI